MGHPTQFSASTPIGFLRASMNELGIAWRVADSLTLQVFAWC
jgi:hypothetical protein